MQMGQSPTTSTNARPHNLAVEYLANQFEELEDYDGNCGELTDGIIHWLGEDRVSILYVDHVGDEDACLLCASGKVWSYHMVPIIDGEVHDAWHPHLILPPGEYASAAFPGQSLRLAFYGGELDGEEEISSSTSKAAARDKDR